jgi:hypothetical protein
LGPYRERIQQFAFYRVEKSNPVGRLQVYFPKELAMTMWLVSKLDESHLISFLKMNNSTMTRFIEFYKQYILLKGQLEAADPESDGTWLEQELDNIMKELRWIGISSNKDEFEKFESSLGL